MKVNQLNFQLGRMNLTHGAKKVSVVDSYDGDKRIIKIYYYDAKFDNSPAPCCCKSPSYCKNEASAIRMINRFFN